MVTEQLQKVFRLQADACERLTSPMYARLLRQCADDIATGGAVREVLRGHEGDRGPSAPALRLMAGVHRFVLAGEEPALAAYYPSVGGTDDPAMWSVFVEAVSRRPEDLRRFLEHPPQTNEVGRAAALLGGLLHTASRHRLPVRLRELGSSAGLNLNADRFGYQVADSDSWWGSPRSPVRLADAWQGVPPPVQSPLTVVDRWGSDVSPVRIDTDDGRIGLLSYIWADMMPRFSRASGALEIAARHPPLVHTWDAEEAVAHVDLLDGHATVVWHSVMWQYLTKDGQEAVRTHLSDIGARASESSPFVHLFLEPVRRTPEAEHELLVVEESWPGGRQRILGSGAAHGVPVVWEV